MSAVILRPARPGDAEAIREIYNWAVRHTTATMATEDRTPAEQDAWLDEHDGLPYPALVAETVEDARVVGYASLSRYIARPGYDPTAEDSVYLHPDWHGVGIGGALLSALLVEASRRGFANVLALISADNEASLRLHRRYGFAEVGTMRRVGYKFGRWVDVAILQWSAAEAAAGANPGA